MTIERTRARAYLRGLGPLVLGEDVVEDAALRSTLEAEGSVVGLGGCQTSESLSTLWSKCYVSYVENIEHTR